MYILDGGETVSPQRQIPLNLHNVNITEFMTKCIFCCFTQELKKKSLCFWDFSFLWDVCFDACHFFSDGKVCICFFQPLSFSGSWEHRRLFSSLSCWWFMSLESRPTQCFYRSERSCDSRKESKLLSASLSLPTVGFLVWWHSQWIMTTDKQGAKGNSVLLLWLIL